MARKLYIIIAGVLAFGIVSGGTVWAWIEFQPDVPASANQTAGQPQNTYAAGGAECRPQRLAAITDADDPIPKAERCAQVQEQYRLDQEDLLQQTRMAETAHDQARIAVFQALLTFWGTVLIVGALAVSVLDLRQGREANRDSIRAYVYAKEATVDWGDNCVRVVINVANDGQTPARWFSLAGSAEFRDIGSGDPIIAATGKPLTWSALGAGSERTAPYVVKEIDEAQLTRTQDNYLSATGVIRYETIFGERKVSEFSFMQIYRRQDRKTMQKSTGLLRVFADDT
mgnify:CR=1 FL=1